MTFLIYSCLYLFSASIVVLEIVVVVVVVVEVVVITILSVTVTDKQSIVETLYYPQLCLPFIMSIKSRNN